MPPLGRKREPVTARVLPLALPGFRPGIVLLHRPFRNELTGAPPFVIAIPMPERDQLVVLIELLGKLVHLEKLMLRPGDRRTRGAGRKRDFVDDLPIAQVREEPELVLDEL